ncbi:hypothetical protein LUZ60_014652 [Juncus effusus]|nr:hypothetical protein LUZ60_014652 [Juncus effusus]
MNQVLSDCLGILKATTVEAKEAKITETMSMLEVLEEAFKKFSKGKPFFGGDTIGFLDVTLGCYLAWFKTVEKLCEHKFLDETKFPELVEWAERFLSADCAKEVTPEVQKIEEYITVIKGRWAAAAAASSN